MSARSINIYNMLPGDDLINEINKSFSGPAREQARNCTSTRII